ncbi:MAG: hypothetical protein VCF07_06740 [Nitrospinota bacterium]
MNTLRRESSSAGSNAALIRIIQAPSMTKESQKGPPGARPGLMEYLLLALLVLVVIVTGWTLFDNGLLDTMASLVK